MAGSAKQKLSKKKQVQIDYLLLLPIIALLVLVPLIVRMVYLEGSEILHIAYKKDEFTDLYSQGKATAIRAITTVMSIIMIFYYRKKELKKSKEIIIYAVAARVYILVTALAAVFSKYPDVALWGAPERAEGLIIIICYIVIMFYTLYAVKSTEQYTTIMYALGTLVVICTIIGIFQYVGADLFATEIGKKIIIPDKLADYRQLLKQEFKSQNMILTMFNPNYVGSFAAMMLPLFSIPIFFKIDIRTRIAALIFAVCSVVLLIGCNSRAGFIGVTVSVALGVVIFSKKALQKKKLMVGALGVIVVLLIAAHSMTQGLLLKEATTLAGDAIEMFSIVDRGYDYKQDLPIRDIQTTQDQAIISLQEGSIAVQVQGENLTFNDENNQIIPYELIDFVYESQDERFEAIKFVPLYRADEETIGGFQLVIDNVIMFDFEAADDGIYILDPYNYDRIENIDPPTIGFWGKEKLGSGRGYIWSRSIPLLKDTLWLGNGPDTFIFFFPQYEFFAKWHIYLHPLVLVDKPHNMYLQIGINQGVLALLAFLTLLITYIIQSIRLYAFRNDYKQYTIGGIAVMLAIVGYAAAGMFNDSTVSVAPLFWALLGAGMAFNYRVKYQDSAI